MSGWEQPDFGPGTGQWIADTLVQGRGEPREMVDPTTAVAYGTVRDASVSQADQAMCAARKAFAVWSAIAPVQRARVLSRAAELIEADAENLATVEAWNVGKPLSQARRDVLRAAEYFRFYAGACDKLNGETIPLGPDQTAMTVPEPIGVTVHILPWNYPISTFARGVAPALAAGATVVAKPSELTPFSAVLLARLMQRAGLPEGAVNVVTGGAEIGAALSGHPETDHVTFTGSTATGRKVMQAASGPVAGVTLELGGKSPVVVLADADLERAADGVIRGIFFNAGQVCAAGARLICEASVHETLLEKVIAQAEKLSMGHPLADPDMGPLVSRAQLERVEGFVARAKAAGLSCNLGGEATAPAAYPDGFYYPPTIFADVPPEAEIAQQEVFGPVLATFTCDDAEHALRLANDSDYGLVAGIYTSNHDAALRFARQVQVGQVFVNGFLSAGDTVPFGGVKRSGIGREKGMAGIAAYQASKSIILNHPGSQR